MEWVEASGVKVRRTFLAETSRGTGSERPTGTCLSTAPRSTGAARCPVGRTWVQRDCNQQATRARYRVPGLAAGLHLPCQELCAAASQVVRVGGSQPSAANGRWLIRWIPGVFYWASTAATLYAAYCSAFGRARGTEYIGEHFCAHRCTAKGPNLKVPWYLAVVASRRLSPGTQALYLPRACTGYLGCADEWCRATRGSAGLAGTKHSTRPFLLRTIRSLRSGPLQCSHRGHRSRRAALRNSPQEASIGSHRGSRESPYATGTLLACTRHLSGPLLQVHHASVDACKYTCDAWTGSFRCGALPGNSNRRHTRPAFFTFRFFFSSGVANSGRHGYVPVDHASDSPTEDDIRLLSHYQADVLAKGHLRWLPLYVRVWKSNL